MKKISVIIPTFNEEKRIRKCLKSITSQKYPKRDIEIIVVDDNSSDKTLSILSKYPVKVFMNGTKNIERGKSIGLENASGEYVFFIDADNEILTSDWFKIASDILEKNRDIIGVQSYRYKYYSHDNCANRYCSLFGINDPMAFYLGKRGQMMYGETTWINPDNLILETDTAFICSYTVHDLPTVGSQGYMTRKSLLKKTNWRPYLFHMDSVYELVDSGNTKIAFIKREIKHDYVDSVYGIVKKLRRNITLYYKQHVQRKYKYNITFIKLGWVVLIMVSFVIPFYDAIKGFLRKRDIAWFIHPFLSFVVICLYSYTTVEYYVLRNFSRDKM